MASIDYPVLRRPRLRAGIGGNAAVLIWAIAGIATIVIGLPWGAMSVVPALLIHGMLTWAFRTDPKVLETYAQYATLPNEFEAGISYEVTEFETRPEGFFRGIAK